MATAQDTSSQPVIQTDASGEEHPALLASGILLDADQPEAGAAISLLRGTLADGAERILVVYSVAPDQVATMASNRDKRDALANAVQSAASEL